MSEAEKRRKDRQELNELLHAIEPAKNEDIARRAISIADYYLIKAENQAKHIRDLEARNSKQPTIEPEKWSGLWSESKNDSSIYGEKLMEGDTIYLLGIEGTVRQECGSWGWGSNKYVPWEELEKKIPHNNSPCFCYCDNFISFWELKWNFDDGYDWDGVPFIRHSSEMEKEGEAE